MKKIEMTKKGSKNEPLKNIMAKNYKLLKICKRSHLSSTSF